MADIYGISAVWQAEKYRDFEPLIQMLEQGSHFVVDDPRARELLANRLRGKKGKTGRTPRSEKDRRLAYWMAALAWYYHGTGLPKHNYHETAKTVSASAKVNQILEGKIHSISPSSVRKAIDEFENFPECKIAYRLGRCGYVLTNPDEPQVWAINELEFFDYQTLELD